MPKCPNCGQKTARTEDWACQWCGYPLLSESYRKLPKTYRELKEETGYKIEAPVVEEVELTPEVVAEVKPEIELAEAEPEEEPETEPATKIESREEPEAKARPARKPKARKKIKAEPAVEPEGEPVSADFELTVNELLSAYETDDAAADAKFIGKALRITGVIDRIEIKDNLDIYYIVLTTEAEKNLLQSVRCTFTRKHGSELSQLEVGQKVTVQGKYDGSIMNISLRNCILV